ncbi:MAG: hypothetical protein ACTSRA_03400 [Promethearchaeota archaeon]
MIVVNLEIKDHYRHQLVYDVCTKDQHFFLFVLKIIEKKPLEQESDTCKPAQPVK